MKSPIDDGSFSLFSQALQAQSLGRPRNYEDIKRIAQLTGMRTPDLLALASQNDPFYIMPAQQQQAEWFAALWERFDLPAGVHLRRIHYRLVSQASPFAMFNGNPYQNTEKCWQDLSAASKSARCLGLVAADAFADKRNPDPVLVRQYSKPPTPGVMIHDCDWWTPRIDADLASDIDWQIPGVRTTGYSVNDHDAQPFHLELISEKSTGDDVIIPLCRQLGINYAPFTGFASITGIVEILKRTRQANKDCIVFYVSDFDPAGSFMPPSVARQLEFWRPQYAPDQQVLLKPIVLTLEQVKQYQLPPIPIKESDKRQDNFLAKYGVKGATELDALEALCPGELANVIARETAPWRDSGAYAKQYHAKWGADEQVSDQWNAISRPHEWRLKRLREQAKAICEQYQDALESLRQAMNADMEPIQEQIDSLRQAIKADFADFDPVLPDAYESPITLPETFDGLFDSRRDYLDQLSAYKRTGAEAKP